MELKLSLTKSTYHQNNQVKQFVMLQSFIYQKLLIQGFLDLEKVFCNISQLST